MSSIQEFKNDFSRVHHRQRSDLHDVSQLINTIHTDIRGEQIKFRKFSNYARPEDKAVKKEKAQLERDRI